MTTEQRLQWVSVPAGTLPDGRRRLSVAMSPRLRTDEGGTLALFPDLLDWPATVAAATWTLDADGTAPAAEVVSPAPDPELWAALFPPQTPVVPWRFPDLADRPMVTFDVLKVHAQLRGLYARAAAASPAELPALRTRRDVEPPVPGLDDLLTEVVRPGQTRYGELERGYGVAGAAARLLSGAREQAAARRAGGVRGGPTIHPLPPGAAFEVERAALFHSSPEAEPHELPPDGQHYRDTVDFHQLVAGLAEHPDLLRRLGLVVDLAFPAQALPTPTGFITATPALAGAADAVVRENLAHHTAYRVDGDRFVAARQVPDAVVPEGLVPLPAGSFVVNQVDVDGAALKAIATATTATTPPPAAGGAALQQPDDAGLAALRTTGLSLVQSGRADALQAEFSRSGTVNSAIEGGSTRLFAEDLVRGYRLDVFDDRTGVWRSLHERVLTTTAERYPAGLAPLPGEGHVQVALAQRLAPPGQAPDPNGELYVHESLVTWDGWSLSAPRAGLPLSRHPDAPDPGRPETLPAAVPNDPQTVMGLSFASAVVPGSLPRLRFGRSYRLRLREVDLVGGGLTRAEADAIGVGALQVEPYLRFEPVPAPTAVPYTAFGEGASLHRLVIRSDAGLEPGQYAEWFTAELPQHPGYAPVDVRHLAPPKASFDLAEKHGLFDLAVGSDGRPPGPEQVAVIAGAYEVARREKGSFDDPEAPGATVVDLPAVGGAAGGRYVLHTVDQLELPYLPDPLATGVIFWGLPGVAPGEAYVLPFDAEDGTWWRARPLRLQLAGGEGPPQWDAAARLLTVALPQAATARVRMASQLPAPELMGMLRWCEQELTGEELDRVVGAMKDNRCWLTTPWHELELVHAVQHPLQVPQWERFEVSRPLGQTYADVAGVLSLDGRSSQRVDLDATWTEPVDDPREDGPRELSARTTVFSLPMDTSALMPEGRPAAYRLRDGKELTFDTRMARELGTGAPTPHHFGDTKYRRVSYAATATTPFREDFPAAWIDEPDRLSVTSQVVTVDVPSSAPPKLPDLQYVVPTMGWSGGEQDGGYVSRRRGGGLRVWMGRGWWSSGAGELLGVVVGSDVISPQGSDYPFVSLIGQDLIRSGAPLRNLRPASFGGDPVVATRVPLVGTPVPFVTVVGHQPQYDATTKRWFADVALDTGEAYAPFVRLALVRYQPNSLDRCAISPVVLADIVQPLPDRTATVTTAADDPAVRTVTVAGPSYTAVHGRGPDAGTEDSVLPQVTVTVQRADPAVADDVLRWQSLPEATTVLTRSVSGTTATWAGRVAVPAVDGELRLLIVEVERLYADGEPEAITSRIVYAAAVPV